eukprot:scaffold4319_cov249-Ochromonas_danica.AAC.2
MSSVETRDQTNKRKREEEKQPSLPNKKAPSGGKSKIEDSLADQKEDSETLPSLINAEEYKEGGEEAEVGEHPLMDQIRQKWGIAQPSNDQVYALFHHRIDGIVKVIQEEASRTGKDERKVLKEFFASPHEKTLPFPSTTRPKGRFKDPPSDSTLFRCFGRRQHFNNLIKNINDEEFLVELYGNIGSGKSHLLAMELGKTEKRFIEGIKDALLLLGRYSVLSPSDPNSLVLTSKKLNDFLEKLKPALLNMGKYRILPILDDWNAIEDDNRQSDWAKEKKNAYEYFGNFQRDMIIARSARSTDAVKEPYMELFERVLVFGGLDELEWINMLKMYESRLLELTVDDGLEGQSVQDIQQRIREELSDLTGRVPLLVHEVLLGKRTEGITIWGELVGEFGKSDTVGCGGAWIKWQLCEFSSDVGGDVLPWRSRKVFEHIETITKAISAGADGSSPVASYDPRFFYHDKKRRKYIFPICGYVRRLMVSILYKLNRAELRGKMMSSWFTRVLSDRSANPSVRGFAFENQCIARMLNDDDKMAEVLGDHIQPRGTKWVVEHFAGDYPEIPPQRAEKKVLMWPTKFNCRYIDCVLILRIYSQVEKREITHIVAVQITLKPFNQHLESYQFYTKRHNGRMDYERYLMAEERVEEVQRHFVWIGNQSHASDIEEKAKVGMPVDENNFRFVYWEPI